MDIRQKINFRRSNAIQSPPSLDDFRRLLQVHDFVKMALNARLLGKYVWGCHGLRPVYTSQFRPATFRARPAEAPVEEGHDERNMRLCRPQSPHLTIYKPQLTSMLSITHRCTGIVLGGYATTFAVVSLLSNKPMVEIIHNISHCNPNFFLVFKLGLIFPFTYHFFNGIRHLIWDAGLGFSLKAVYISGILMLLCSIAAAGGIMYLGEEWKKMENERREEELRKAILEAKSHAEKQTKKKCKKKKKKSA